MDTVDEKSLYEDLQDSFAEHESDEPDENEIGAEAESVEAEPASDRDENGRFKAKAEPTDAPATDAAPAEPVGLSVDKAPSSWTPASREKWADIPADIKQEIIRREEASANGVRQMQERFQPMQQFVEALRPVAEEAKQAGMSPDQYIHSLAQSAHTLRTSDVPAKFQELLRIADQFGVPLRDVINQSVGQEVLKKPQSQQAQLPPEVQREFHEMRQWREHMERQNVNNGIQQFSTDKEFFEDVRHQMADLVERGIAQDLPSAYEQACWMNPGVREVMLARQGQATAQSSIQQKQAKATGASLKSGGKVHVPDPEGDDDDIADTVRRAYNSAATGRV